jgi:hypothetical protein
MNQAGGGLCARRAHLPASQRTLGTPYRRRQDPRNAWLRAVSLGYLRQRRPDVVDPSRHESSLGSHRVPASRPNGAPRGTTAFDDRAISHGTIPSATTRSYSSGGADPDLRLPLPTHAGRLETMVRDARIWRGAGPTTLSVPGPAFVETRHRPPIRYHRRVR